MKKIIVTALFFFAAANLAHATDVKVLGGKVYVEHPSGAVGLVEPSMVVGKIPADGTYDAVVKWDRKLRSYGEGPDTVTFSES